MKTKHIVLMGLLIALEIVLSRFLSIQALTVRIGFSFVALALAGFLLGPLKAGIVAGVADILGLFLFSGGTFNPGITLDAILTGVVFGIFLNTLGASKRSIVVAVLINCLSISLCLQSLWLSLLYGMEYNAVVLSRVPQVFISIPVQYLLITLLCNKRMYRCLVKEGIV